MDEENILNNTEENIDGSEGTETTENTEGTGATENGTEGTGTESGEERVQLQGKHTSTDRNRYQRISPMDLHGRRQIFTNEKDITRENVLRVLNRAMDIHRANREEEVYLEKYLRGVQPILDRVKVYHNEICNKIVVNIASQIVAFKKAEFAGEPIQYVSRGKNRGVPEKIESLNSMMLSEGKKSKDLELAGQMFTYGVGYRLVIQNQEDSTGEFDESPFEIHIPDPRNTFVVRYNDVSKRVVMGVTYVYLDELKNRVRYTVYTKDAVFVVDGTSLRATKIVNVKVHKFGMVTLIEYPCNSSYMGAFEVVLPLLDAINLTQSNRLDGVEQFVQALMVFDGVDITREQFLELKDLGAIRLPPTMDGNSGKKLYYLNEQLDQAQTQTLVDDMYQTVLQIVGMPSQGNANTSDSSNNGAMLIKNGWWNAEARAQETEGHWTEAETEFLKVVLKMCSDSDALTGLKVSDVEPKFGRRSYEDKLVKTQSFTTLLGAGVPPIQAYKYSGLDSDPEAATMQYEAYRNAQEAKEEAKIQKELDEERRRIANGDKENAGAVPDRGSDTAESEQDNPEED